MSLSRPTIVLLYLLSLATANEKKITALLFFKVVSNKDVIHI